MPEHESELDHVEAAHEQYQETDPNAPYYDGPDLPVERDLWWGYLCPALANIGALKRAQADLVALGADWAEAGRILSRVQSFYVDAAHDAAKRYLSESPTPPGQAT